MSDQFGRQCQSLRFSCLWVKSERPISSVRQGPETAPQNTYSSVQYPCRATLFLKPGKLGLCGFDVMTVVRQSVIRRSSLPPF